MCIYTTCTTLCIFMTIQKERNSSHLSRKPLHRWIRMCLTFGQVWQDFKMSNQGSGSEEKMSSRQTSKVFSRNHCFTSLCQALEKPGFNLKLQTMIFDPTVIWQSWHFISVQVWTARKLFNIWSWWGNGFISIQLSCTMSTEYTLCHKTDQKYGQNNG